MRVGLRTLASETVQWPGEALVAGTLSRAALARELCVQDDWRKSRRARSAASRPGGRDPASIGPCASSCARTTSTRACGSACLSWARRGTALRAATCRRCSRGAPPARPPTAYRLLANPRVTMDDILQPHREAVAERCALETTVLLVQGTTTLNYGGLKNCTVGLGPPGGTSKGKDGLLVRAGLALAEGGRALGVFWLRPRARLEELKTLAGGKRAESERWLEGFEQAAEPDAAGLLVRGRQPLWQHMRQLGPVVRERVVRIGAHGGKHARTQRKARTEVRVRSRRAAGAQGARRARRGAGRAGERAGAAPAAATAGLAAAVERRGGHRAGRPAHGGAIRAAQADRGVLQGAQARHEAARPAPPRGRQHRELPRVRGDQRVEGVRHHAPGPRAGPEAPATESFSPREIALLHKLLNAERILPLGGGSHCVSQCPH